MDGRPLEVTHVTSLKLSSDVWVSPNVFQLNLGFATYVSADVGFRELSFSLCWFSQKYVHLMLAVAECVELTLALAELCFNSCWVWHNVV